MITEDCGVVSTLSCKVNKSLASFAGMIGVDRGGEELDRLRVGQLYALRQLYGSTVVSFGEQLLLHFFHEVRDYGF